MLFFKWWYGAGFEEQLKRVKRLLFTIYDYFSIDLLLNTLFSPYKNDLNNYAGASVDVKLKGLSESVVSRFVGFCVRSAILIAGFVIYIFSALLSGVWLIIWVTMPMLVVALPILGVVL